MPQWAAWRLACAGSSTACRAATTPCTLLAAAARRRCRLCVQWWGSFWRERCRSSSRSQEGRAGAAQQRRPGAALAAQQGQLWRARGRLQKWRSLLLARARPSPPRSGRSGGRLLHQQAITFIGTGSLSTSTCCTATGRGGQLHVWTRPRPMDAQIHVCNCISSTGLMKWREQASREKCLMGAAVRGASREVGQTEKGLPRTNGVRVGTSNNTVRRAWRGLGEWVRKSRGKRRSADCTTLKAARHHAAAAGAAGSPAGFTAHPHPPVVFLPFFLGTGRTLLVLLVL